MCVSIGTDSLPAGYGSLTNTGKADRFIHLVFIASLIDIQGRAAYGPNEAYFLDLWGTMPSAS